MSLNGIPLAPLENQEKPRYNKLIINGDHWHEKSQRTGLVHLGEKGERHAIERNDLRRMTR
jgi:hypothetical protein